MKQNILYVVVFVISYLAGYFASPNSSNQYKDGFDDGYSLGEYYYMRAAVAFWECSSTGIHGFWSPVHGYTASIRCTRSDEIVITPCSIDPISIGFSFSEYVERYGDKCKFYTPEYQPDLGDYYKQ